MCDMAETYHIYEYETLPVKTLAVLSSGLRDDSRIKMKINGMKSIPLEIIAADAADTLKLFVCAMSGTQERPTLFSDLRETGEKQETKKRNAIQAFDSEEDFKKAWREKAWREKTERQS